ncbi:hypothetical protein LHYA1_G000206 [Lachnellula hyalina]|uniref:Uncharacterized protein n=1 Tax=Lachnellula hyalina TaxID=1316788 RepID=A0A8H8R9F8_9HELO|nr:uncharacterized protein LHYA1_G000206 [Lachnellula hyalina]TVY31036.1 hypothetical protein LHYA1_G000206 [Lachnellula hyalina]
MPPSNILSQLRLAGIRVPQTSMRHFSQHRSSQYPRKDSQNKDSIDTEATEYTKSGTDDQTAANEDAAFNPDITSPEAEKKAAGKGNEGKTNGNPLEVSPANRDISHQTDGQHAGAENSRGGSGKQSGFGGPQKKGGS